MPALGCHRRVGSEKDWSANPKTSAETLAGRRRNGATRALVKQILSTNAAPKKECPTSQPPREAPGQPNWNTRRARAGSLALDFAVLDLGNHHLQCSGQGGQENGHLGPRHAIREARVQFKSSAPVHQHCHDRGTACCVCMCDACLVPPKSPVARQS